MSLKYLNRFLVEGPYLALCTDPKKFVSECRRLKIPEHEIPGFLGRDGAHATTHFLRNPAGQMVSIVTMSLSKHDAREQQYALLVHEAVHIFRRFCTEIGEDRPSEEFEAYSIQGIAQRLMLALAEQRT